MLAAASSGKPHSWPDARRAHHLADRGPRRRSGQRWPRGLGRIPCLTSAKTTGESSRLLKYLRYWVWPSAMDELTCLAREDLDAMTAGQDEATRSAPASGTSS